MKTTKNKARFLTLLMASLMFSFAASETQAQKKKNKVKRHVKQNHTRKAKSRAHVRRAAHYKYRNLPRRGKVVRKVGGTRIGFRGTNFRFYKGVWYRPYGKRFIVARAPLGIRVRVLPVGFRRIVIGPRPFFYHYGTFYVKVKNSEEYEVVAAPIGAEIDAL
ncbi:MAG: DUF6515 family protein, partial [Flavobacteriaceae bacterium]